MAIQGPDFSAAELAHVAATTLDHFVNKGGSPFYQEIQEKPLLKKMEAKKKPYSGGKEMISIPVKGKHGNGGTNDSIVGFTHDDAASNFYNPANVTRAVFPWREHHLGITMTETELKGQGILITDGFGDQNKSGYSAKQKAEILVPILEDKYQDFSEQWARKMNELMWDDGTSDTKALAGLTSIIAEIPTVGIVGGINAATAGNEFWRNRARTAAFAAAGSYDATYGGDKVTSSPTNGGALIQVLQFELRQLRRYGGKPDTFLAGSDFIDALEKEIRANGSYSDNGFTGSQDGGMGDLKFKGIPVIYDPTLDDLSKSKFAYLFDCNDIYINHLNGDWNRTRNPARPYNQFIFHKSMIATGQMVCRRRNSALVVEIN